MGPKKNANKSTPKGTPKATEQRTPAQTAQTGQFKAPASGQNVHPAAALQKMSTTPVGSPVQAPTPIGGQTPLTGNTGAWAAGLGIVENGNDFFKQMLAAGNMRFDPNAYGGKEANEKAKQNALSRESSKTNTPIPAVGKKTGNGSNLSVSDGKRVNEGARQKGSPPENPKANTPAFATDKNGKGSDLSASSGKKANEGAKQKGPSRKSKKTGSGFNPNASGGQGANEKAKQKALSRESPNTGFPTSTVGKNKDNGLAPNASSGKGASENAKQMRENYKENTLASTVEKKNVNRQSSPVDKSANTKVKPTKIHDQQRPPALRSARRSPDPFQSPSMESSAKILRITFPKDESGKLLKQATTSSRSASPTPDRHSKISGAGEKNAEEMTGSAEAKNVKNSSMSGSSSSETPPSLAAPVAKPTQTPNNRLSMSTKSVSNNEIASGPPIRAMAATPSDSPTKRHLFAMSFTPPELTEEQKEDSRRSMALAQEAEQARWAKPTPGVMQTWGTMPMTRDQLAWTFQERKRTDRQKLNMIYRQAMNMLDAIDKKDEKLADLQAKLDDQKKKLADQEKNLKNREKDLNLCGETISQKNEEIQKQEDELAQMRKKLEGDKQEISNRESHINSSEQRTVILEDQLRSTRASVELLSKEKRDLTKRLADKEEESLKLLKENEKLDEERKKNLVRIDRVESENKALQEEVFRKSVNDDNENLKMRLEDSQEEVAAVVQKLKDTQAELRSLEFTIDELEKEKARMLASNDSDQDLSNADHGELDNIFTPSDEETASDIVTPMVADASISTDPATDKKSNREVATIDNGAPEVQKQFVDNSTQTTDTDVPTADAATQTEAVEAASGQDAVLPRWKRIGNFLITIMMVAAVLVVFFGHCEERDLWLEANEDSRQRVVSLMEAYWTPPHWWEVLQFRIIEWIDEDRAFYQ